MKGPVYAYKSPRKTSFSLHLELRQVFFLSPFAGQVASHPPKLSFIYCHSLGDTDLSRKLWSDFPHCTDLKLCLCPRPALENWSSDLSGISRRPWESIGTLPTYLSGLLLYYYFASSIYLLFCQFSYGISFHVVKYFISYFGVFCTRGVSRTF